MNIEVESKAVAEVSSPYSPGVLRHAKSPVISTQSHSCKWVCLVVQRQGMKSNMSRIELAIQCCALAT